jgi:hypothetical protein
MKFDVVYYEILKKLNITNSKRNIFGMFVCQEKTNFFSQTPFAKKFW